MLHRLGVRSGFMLDHLLRMMIALGVREYPLSCLVLFRRGRAAMFMCALCVVLIIGLRLRRMFVCIVRRRVSSPLIGLAATGNSTAILAFLG